jgi:ribosomal protein S18 acetylase RimI-like enzyme
MSNEELNATSEKSRDLASVEIGRANDIDSIRKANHLFDREVNLTAAERFLSSEGHHLLLAYESASPVGFVTGVEMTHPDKGTEMFLYELGVTEKHRRKGIGTALVRSLRDLAKERSCYDMWVLTDQTNTAALAAYSNAGGERGDDQVMLSWMFRSTVADDSHRPEQTG